MAGDQDEGADNWGDDEDQAKLADFIATLGQVTTSIMGQARQLIDSGETPYLVRSTLHDMADPFIDDAPEVIRVALVQYLAEMFDLFFQSQQPGSEG